MYDASHKCALPPPLDEIEILLRTSSYFSIFGVCWMKHRLVSAKYCKYAYTNLKSHDDIVWEKKRMIIFHPHSIHPYSAFRINWEIFMIVVLIVDFIIIPFHLGYYWLLMGTKAIYGVKALMLFCEAVCILDIIFNFFTGYYDRGQLEIILDNKKIFRHYLYKYFAFDIISNVPTIYLVCGIFVDIPTNDFLNWMFLLRYLILNRYLNKIFDVFNVNYYVSLWVKILLLFVLISHFIIHINSYIWIADLILNEHKNTENNAFIICKIIYIASTVLSKCSHNLERKIGMLARNCMIITWFLSYFIQLILMTYFLEYLRAYNSPERKYANLVEQLKTHSHYRELPTKLRKRLLKYFEFHFNQTYFNETQIMNNLSNQLRQNFIIENCRQLIKNVRFLKNIPVDLVLRIAHSMRTEDYLAGETIIHANTTGTSMYFIATGKVAVYTSGGDEVCHLEDGDHFGEVAILMNNKMRTATIVAIENCKLYRLENEDFLKAMRSHPDKLEEIQRVAEDRLRVIEVLKNVAI